MDTLEKELAELKTFIADLKSDRAAQKEKEKRESWTKYTSMSLVFIAVLAAIATQWAGKYSSRTLVKLNESTFHQASASDKWGEYQASSIKRNMYEMLHDSAPKESADSADAAKREEAFKAKVLKYQQRQDETKTTADGFEHKRDEAQDAAKNSSAHGGAMGNAVAIFQIAIAMGSICLVTKKKWLWYVSLALSALATVKMMMVIMVIRY